MNNRFYKTIIKIEVLSEGPIVSELPIDKLLSYIEYEGTFGNFSNSVEVAESNPITLEELKNACAQHGTDPGFFTEVDEDTYDEFDLEAPFGRSKKT
mgnify:CR=1 FL=1|jgi:hypothetical protein